MAVFRVEKTKNYAVMSKHHFQDKSILLNNLKSLTQNNRVLDKLRFCGIMYSNKL